ncbi:MAG: hypothetical protein KBT06_09420 [Prevotellaceae bacterium]|nr:hypothetical protein [Candidatus Colivivens equi]MCQ2075509.1 hypothetical protein [Bacteroidaceae bacterium]
MTEDENRIIKNFEARVRSLILQYQTLQEEVTSLQKMILEKDEEIKHLQVELGQCKDDYSHLKIARMIEVSDSDVKDAKARITRLVREVNKCIGLLSIE